MNVPTIEIVKREAHQLKKLQGIKHMHALHVISLSYGFKSFNALIAYWKAKS